MKHTLLAVASSIMLLATAYLINTDDPRCTGRIQPSFCAN